MAVKVLAVDPEDDETNAALVKEITVMQECDSEYIVGYIGSYLKANELWVCRIQMFL